MGLNNPQHSHHGTGLIHFLFPGFRSLLESYPIVNHPENFCSKAVHDFLRYPVHDPKSGSRARILNRSISIVNWLSTQIRSIHTLSLSHSLTSTERETEKERERIFLLHCWRLRSAMATPTYNVSMCKHTFITITLTIYYEYGIHVTKYNRFTMPTLETQQCLYTG